MNKIHTSTCTYIFALAGDTVALESLTTLTHTVLVTEGIPVAVLVSVAHVCRWKSVFWMAA